MSHSMPHPPSPCTNLCSVNPDTDLCAGCLRTLDEIAMWSGMTPEEKRRVLDSVSARRAAREESNRRSLE
jgi:predicted Fe-S protein YdhL (DUF1289 family)